MACIWLYSDPHFSQQSMCNFKRPDGTKLRPWTTAAEMDEELIKRYNEVVRPQDKVYILGDVVMKDKNLPIVARLNGHKRLVRGNHDMEKTKLYMQYFEEIYGVRVLDAMILSHIPLHPDSMTPRYATNIHGHLHAGEVKDMNGLPDSRYFNVSVEQTDFAPISIEELRVRIQAKKDLYPSVYSNFHKGPD